VAENRYEMSAEEKIEALREAMHDVYKFDPHMLINMFHLQSSETIKNLSKKLVKDIKKLSRSSLSIMARFLDDDVKQGAFINKSSTILADIIWSMFSGIVLLEESKRMIHEEKSYLEKTLDTAFEIIKRGILREPVQKKYAVSGKRSVPELKSPVRELVK